MFWSSKKPTREEEKEKHIKGLQHAFPSMRRPNNDNELFEVRFVVDGQFSSLRILVNGEFPNTPPVIQAHGPVNHSWLDPQKFVIGSPKLKHWGKQSHLAEVVEECVQALMAGTNVPLSKPQLDSYGRPVAQQNTAQPTTTGGAIPAPQPTPAPMPVATAAPVYNNPFAPPPVSALSSNQRLPTSSSAAIPPQSQPSTYGYPGVVSPGYPSAMNAPVAAPAVAPATQSHQTQYGQYNAYPAISPAMTPAVTPMTQHLNNNNGYSAIPGPGAISYSSTSMGPTSAMSPASSANSGYAAVPAPASSSSYSAVPGIAAVPTPVSSAKVTPVGSSHITSTPPAVVNPSTENSTKSNNSTSGSKKATAKEEFMTPIAIPDVPASFPELEKLTDIQLERLLNDDVALTAQASKVDSISIVTTIRDQLHQANHERATNNVKMSEEIMALQRQATELQNKLRGKTNEYQVMTDDATKKFGSDMNGVVAELNQKKNVLDIQSEELGRKLVQGDTELSAFMKEYLDVRTKYHNLNDRIALATQVSTHV